MSSCNLPQNNIYSTPTDQICNLLENAIKEAAIEGEERINKIQQTAEKIKFNQLVMKEDLEDLNSDVNKIKSEIKELSADFEETFIQQEKLKKKE